MPPPLKGALKKVEGTTEIFPALCEIEFGAYSPQNMTSGGNNFQ